MSEANEAIPRPKLADAAPGGGDAVVIASNRLPFTLHRSTEGLERRPSPGGLVSALEPVLLRRGGTWVGWPGLELKTDEQYHPALEGDEKYRVRPVELDSSDIKRYYHGFSNATLWPLFHSMPQYARFDRADFAIYTKVNERFAEAIDSAADGAGLVWIHDYQLMLAPIALRALRPKARIGYFLHIPFPPYDLFRLLPWDRQLLRGLLACDLVGFHVPGYALNFLDCVERRLGARVDREAMVVEYGDRLVRVGAFPIGIDYHHFERLAQEVSTRNQDAARGERIVLGVDRLDYTKGIPERIKAFQRLLELHPEYREQVVLIQIAVPSRAQTAGYKELKREIEALVGHVNGRFATASWSPIRYIHRAIPHERLAGIYRDADVALVTPLRDGMNLVAKEFVAAQVDEPGVLVLSRMAGAAETMREALDVNPNDLEETAESIHRALEMDRTERRSRMTALRRRELRDDVHSWVERFMESAISQHAAIAPLTDRDFQGWLGSYLTRPKLALFLDYDGTLTDLVDHPSDAKLTDEARATLDACAARPDTEVAIVSGRALADVRQLVGNNELTYAGNHGLEIEGEGIEFRHEDLVHYQSRVEALAAALGEVSLEGAWVEAKGPTLTYHYRQVDGGARAPLIERCREIIEAAGFQTREAHCALEARPPIGWDKGRAVLHILRARHGPSWAEATRVIYVGDDQTDEDAFRFLAGLSMTFRVGPDDVLTAASHRLPHPRAVQALLGYLSRRPPA